MSDESPAPRSDAYEFGQEHNLELAKLASVMRLVGTCFFVLGLVSILGFLVVALSGLVGLVLTALILGLYFMSLSGPTRMAALGFRRIVETSGRDISHLMEALAGLAELYFLNVLAGAVVLGILLAAELILRSIG
jgi:hypothetical protein